MGPSCCVDCVSSVEESSSSSLWAWRRRFWPRNWDAPRVDWVGARRPLPSRTLVSSSRNAVSKPST